MKKIEILSPAGDYETLQIAVKCGCDAVYISGKSFGARKYAPNFTLDEIEKAVKYCHLYGVKLYITVNTLIDQFEIENAVDYVRKLHILGVDALIVQDIGFISLVRKKFPNLEIHASTQTHNTNNETLKFLRKMGCSRAVLAREMSVDYIKNITADIELEVFIHGALCVCYSGCCLMSSKLFGRSGNKGECAAPCRFKYDLYNGKDIIETNGNYLLSMKELCVAQEIGKLISLGVNSLKIEGRMKSKYYVGYVTTFYRRLIDKYYRGESLTFTKEEYIKLLKLYNRNFTKGFLNNETSVVNVEACNHMGYPLGKILSSGNKLKIKLSDDIKQGDGIRLPSGNGMICNYIYNKRGLLMNKAKKGDIIYLDNKNHLNEFGDVYKTLDISLEDEILRFPNKKIFIDFEVIAKKNKPFTVSIIAGDDKVTKSLDIVLEARNVCTTKKDIQEKLGKLGSTPFLLNNIKFDIDENIFIPIKNINNLRRMLVQELIELRECKKVRFVEKEISLKSNSVCLTNEVSFLVRNEEQLKTLISYDVLIYVEDFLLYTKYSSNEKVYFRGSRIESSNLNRLVVANNGDFLINNNSNISDVYMNVVNSFTVNKYLKYVYKVGLSPELSLNDLKILMLGYKRAYNTFPNVEVLIYGKLELMIMKYCPINKNVLWNGVCNACFSNKFYLDDRGNHRFRLLGDNNHYMRIYDFENVDFLDKVDYLKSIGITNFRIDLLDEDVKEIKTILEKLNKEEKISKETLPEYS